MLPLTATILLILFMNKSLRDRTLDVPTHQPFATMAKACPILG